MGRFKKDSGKWLVTYSDLITLLLVFFVLLYMLTPGIDESRFDSLISHFQGSDGIMEQPAVRQGRESDSSQDYRDRIMNQWQMIEDFLAENGLSSQVNIVEMEDGVMISLSDDMTFQSGSSDLLPDARGLLGEIAGLFDEDIEEAEVQGHTDNVPLSGNSAFQSNWHLGAARAVSVITFIQDRTTMEPERFRATSFGEYRPVAVNDTPDGRRQNRRVEIYVRYKRLSAESGQEPINSE